ncbi:RNA-binding Ran Zn-finger protein and related proteins [Phaffia rhodozyma]|uniref:RNA-binding Ran Zn-finger protein and related proteins n=1 Tax=Phaffia rhodozyma TaxID=264483 RepID=A0A0F7SKM2_PHARH|nr:RNA-binding Ran Zn-finger protein and related proteins [Phaffia rhodozyma]
MFSSLLSALALALFLVPITILHPHPLALAPLHLCSLPAETTHHMLAYPPLTNHLDRNQAHTPTHTQPAAIRGDIDSFLSSRSRVVHISGLPPASVTGTFDSSGEKFISREALVDWISQNNARVIQVWGERPKTGDLLMSWWVVFESHQQARNVLRFNQTIAFNCRVSVLPASESDLRPFEKLVRMPARGDYRDSTNLTSSGLPCPLNPTLSSPPGPTLPSPPKHILPDLAPSSSFERTPSLSSSISSGSSLMNHSFTNRGAPPFTPRPPWETPDLVRSSPEQIESIWPETLSDALPSSSSSPGAVQWRSGDWICPSDTCSFHNFSRNDRCIVCHCAKPTAISTRTQSINHPIASYNQAQPESISPARPNLQKTYPSTSVPPSPMFPGMEAFSPLMGSSFRPLHLSSSAPDFETCLRVNAPTFSPSLSSKIRPVSTGGNVSGQSVLGQPFLPYVGGLNLQNIQTIPTNESLSDRRDFALGSTEGTNPNIMKRRSLPRGLELTGLGEIPGSAYGRFDRARKSIQNMDTGEKLQPILNTGNTGPMVFQPGDWACGECGFVNWRRRDHCLRCFPAAKGNEVAGIAIATSVMMANQLAQDTPPIHRPTPTLGSMVSSPTSITPQPGLFTNATFSGPKHAREESLDMTQKTASFDAFGRKVSSPRPLSLDSYSSAGLQQAQHRKHGLCNSLSNILSSASVVDELSNFDTVWKIKTYK